MFDCSADVKAFHAKNVTLQMTHRTEMRIRRDANRERLKTRLDIQPEYFIKQGSYAMKTMIQDPDNDYDIDDGVYFSKDSIKKSNGEYMSPKEVRKMLCEALKDERFNRQPIVKTNCVRVFYEAGYHVDMPIYRIDGDLYELASGDKWLSSRSSEVEEWFDDKNQSLSPDTDDGRQFRRIVRFLKKFARSRKTWKSEIASGFIITKLASECYVSDADREDLALRSTMQKIYTRLQGSLFVTHPVSMGMFLTDGIEDPSVVFFRDKLEDALDTLSILDSEDCDKQKALSAWDSVFNTTFFSERVSSKSASNTLANLVSSKEDPQAVEKRGGGRFA